ncbi:MAG TPA: alpha/beta hydrolase-fold protein [Agriterribacter sp.]|nr:alpha/beta hydrolase-fold protein [Agriterribacter sp.]
MMGTFRTTEISDPLFENANLRYITVKSNHLKGRGDICVFVPGVANTSNLPIVILLHGVYGSAWAWSQKGGAHITASRLIKAGQIKPMILAMPSDGLWGDGSAYLPHNQFDFEQWIVNDVPAAVIENIEGASDQSKIFISGLSMGGFGALRLGAKYSSLFSGISAHSAITSLEQMSQFVEEPLTCYTQAEKHDEDVFATMLLHKDTLPPIRFDCGITDELILYNRTLHQKMEEQHIPHQYAEFEGGHEWPYWIEHLKDSLLFFNQPG